MLQLNLKYSKHAREQMVARGIEEGQVQEAIKRGSKGLQYPNKLLFFYKYFCVVCRKVGETYFIITVKPR